MQPSLIFVPIVLPVLFWSWYHYYKDRHLPEPVARLVLAFAMGMAGYWLGMAMYEGLGLVGLRFDAFLLADTDRSALLLYALLAIGPIEELAKLLPFMAVVYWFPEFDEPIDGIIYASFIALGFSTVENFYYLQYVSDMEALARGFAGPVVHIVFASIWGYYVGRACLRRRRIALTVLVSLVGTAGLHGLYDYLVIALPIFALPASALLVVAIWLWRLFLIRDLHQEAESRLVSR
jgi:RsiW-degrading membrane proteinase PrsW (M82 family)